MSAGQPKSGETITALVRVYNGERHVAETLESILSQTRPADEVLVIDDGSTDGTPAELRRFGNRIRVVRQANGGQASALNRGFLEARGEYVAQCDADDLWRPDRLERQVAALAAHPEIDIAFGAARVFGLVDAHYGLTGELDRPGIVDRGAFARALFRDNVICPSSILVRRRLYLRLGPFIEDAVGGDYDFYLRALAAGAVFHYDTESLVRYRRHDGQVTSNDLEVRRAAHAARLSHARALDDPRFVRSVLARDLHSIGRILVDQRPAEARAAFRDSIWQRPSVSAVAWFGLLAAPTTLRRGLVRSARAVRRRASPSPARGAPA